MSLISYHREIHRLFRFLVPEGAWVLELGCGRGDLLAVLKPGHGLGIDRSEEAVATAREIHSCRENLEFVTGDVESFDWGNREPFDVIVAADLVASLNDVQQTLAHLLPVCTPRTRLILNFHSNLWRPLLGLATFLRLRLRQCDFNWLSSADMRNILYLAGFECVSSGGRILLPLNIPLLSWLFNRVLARLPLLRLGCLTWYLVARPIPGTVPNAANPAPSVSIMVPTRNERGNIEAIFERTPVLGAWSELVFVDGGSTDGTTAEIERCMAAFGNKWEHVKILEQTGRGKGQAVRQGFAACRGDILMILDSDLTVPPEALLKVFEALASGRGEFINGCRLVYPQEDRAMRFFNLVGNHLFVMVFSWLIGQRVKDTLCGTKALWRRDYKKMAVGRADFSASDPFGDFALLFGAAMLNLRIVDLPIRYRARTYGKVKIRRWRDGLRLARMCLAAYRRFKMS